MKLFNFLKILIIFLNTINFLHAQHIIGNNLVPNPSFEDYLICPPTSGQIFRAIPWNAARLPFHSGSTDYIHSCSPALDIQLINQLNQPLTGKGCAGICPYFNPIYYPDYREYAEVQLIQKMIKGKKYCCSFYTILSTWGNIAIENFGILITKDYVCSFNPLAHGLFLIDSIPQIINRKGIIFDSINWTKISGVYLSEGREQYITIGNFKRDNFTNWAALNQLEVCAYYLIDDVSVCECSFDINLGADTVLCEGETIILNPNLPNATYTWQDSSHTATYEVKQPGTYWVRAYVAEYDVYSSDTIVITQGDDNFCNPPLTIPNVITPNGDGANDNFVIQNAESYNITLQIYNRWGRLIYENTNYQNDFSCKTCAAGVYYYVLKAKSKRNGREKEYKGSLTIVNG